MTVHSLSLCSFVQVFYVFLGWVSGYFSARLYKSELISMYAGSYVHVPSPQQ